MRTLSDTVYTAKFRYTAGSDLGIIAPMTMNPSANKGGCDFQTETHLCGRQPGHTGEHYLVAKLMPPTSGPDFDERFRAFILAGQYRRLPGRANADVELFEWHRYCGN